MDTCPRIGKWFRGCQYKARYDHLAPTIDNDNYTGWKTDYLDALEISKPEIYVRDVCIRCGRTVERKPLSSEGDGQ